MNLPKPPHDPVNHPQHYTLHPSGVECIQITRHFNFNLGNAIKYIWRAGLKGGKMEDLQKACWYLNDEIARIAPPPQPQFFDVVPQENSYDPTKVTTNF